MDNNTFTNNATEEKREANLIFFQDSQMNPFVINQNEIRKIEGWGEKSTHVTWVDGSTTMIRLSFEELYEKIFGFKPEIKEMDPLDLTLEDLDLRVRTFNVLKRGGLGTVRDVIDRASEIPNFRGFDKKVIEDLKKALNKFGIELKENPAKPETDSDSISKLQKCTSVHTWNIIKITRCTTLQELAAFGKDNLFKIKSCGNGTIQSIERCLKIFGYTLAD